jgi:hypothetical protein
MPLGCTEGSPNLGGRTASPAVVSACSQINAEVMLFWFAILDATWAGCSPGAIGTNPGPNVERWVGCSWLEHRFLHKLGRWFRWVSGQIWSLGQTIRVFLAAAVSFGRSVMRVDTREQPGDYRCATPWPSTIFGAEGFEKTIV